MNYLITFRCYGTWLHGDERGAVDRNHNQPGEDWLPADLRHETHRAILMKGAAVSLDDMAQSTVTAAITDVAMHREWTILALNVLPTHVHVVVTAQDHIRPEKVMNDFKAWATRRLREQNLFSAEATIWAHHGSTRYLNDAASVHAACHYVTHRQAEPGDERYEPEAGDQRPRSVSDGLLAASLTTTL